MRLHGAPLIFLGDKNMTVNFLFFWLLQPFLPWLCMQWSLRLRCMGCIIDVLLGSGLQNSTLWQIVVFCRGLHHACLTHPIDRQGIWTGRQSEAPWYCSRSTHGILGVTFLSYFLKTGFQDTVYPRRQLAGGNLCACDLWPTSSQIPWALSMQ